MNEMDFEVVEQYSEAICSSPETSDGTTVGVLIDCSQCMDLDKQFGNPLWNAVFLSCDCDQYLTRSQGRAYIGSQFEDAVYHGGVGMVARSSMC